MFEVGDKIVHPQHGAGVVSAIERDVIQGFGCYYVIDLAAYNRTLMIPVDKADDIGVRAISAPDTMSEVLQTLTEEPVTLPGNYTQRQIKLGERLKSGDVFEVARSHARSRVSRPVQAFDDPRQRLPRAGPALPGQ